MPDVFISYAREDDEWVRPLVTALEASGRSVFWDRRVPAGKTWRTHIGAALEQARCVVVVWSEHSVASKFVLEEADEGKQRDVLVPVLRSSVRPPFGFREIHAADLSCWSLGSPSTAFDAFLADIAMLLDTNTNITASKPAISDAPSPILLHEKATSTDIDTPPRSTSTELQRPEVSEWSSSLHPWMLAVLPMIWLFLGTSYHYDHINWNFSALFIPLAFWLGGRYKAHGLRFLKIAALPLLAQTDFRGFQTPGTPGLYMALRLIARLAGQTSYRNNSLYATSLNLRQLAFLFLPLSLDPGYDGDFGNFAIWLHLDPQFYLSMLLLVVGFGTVRLRPVITALAMACIVGTCFRLLQAFPTFSGFSAVYYLDDVSDFSEGITALICGRALHYAIISGNAANARKHYTTFYLSVILSIVFIARWMHLDLSALGQPQTVVQKIQPFSFDGASATSVVLLLVVLPAVAGGRGMCSAFGIWLAGFSVPAILIAIGVGNSPHNFALTTSMTLRLEVPYGFIGPSFPLAPGWDCYPLDFLFIIFGWRVGQAIRALPGTIATSDSMGLADCLPPPLQFRFMDIAWVAISTIYLLAALLEALGRAGV